MSASPAVPEQKAPEVVADGQQKQRKKKTPPLTSEEFTAEVNSTEAAWTKIHKYYSNYNRNGVRTAPTSPNTKETAAVLPLISKLARLFDMYNNKPKRHVTDHPVKGFKQEKLLNANAINFFNTAAGFPEDCKILPLAGAGGDGTFSIAQAISTMAIYVNLKKLKKNPDVKTEVTFDDATKALFGPVIGRIEKKKWEQRPNGEIVTSQPTIQALLPALFDAKVPIHPTLYTKTEQERMEKRALHLAKQTKENGEARKLKLEEQKLADKAARKVAQGVALTETK